MLLALDTSTRYASVALFHQGELRADLTWLVENRHSAELLLRVQETLRAQSVKPLELDGIAVARGPGSFNGVRAGVATAKGLALALSVPLVGVPTLDVLAWGARLAPNEIWALLDAGRGEVYAAAYETAGAEPSRWAPRSIDNGDGRGESLYHILAPATLAALVTDGAIVVGELRPATRAAIVTALDGRARVEVDGDGRRGAWLAALGQARLDGARAESPAALEPLYVRKPAITQSARPDIAALAASDHAAGGRGGERLAL